MQAHYARTHTHPHPHSHEEKYDHYPDPGPSSRAPASGGSGSTTSPTETDELWCPDEDLLAIPPPDPLLESTADPMFPSPHKFNLMVQDYLRNLSPKKREKALLTQKMYDAVLAVLQDPKDTSTKTAQFRFWAKKMFQLTSFGGESVICHDHKPVAVKEQIYEVLCHCHGQAGHGGRDKTSAQVRRYYSWIPKEIIARFVRDCPFCQSRRTQSSAGLGSMSESQAFLISLQTTAEQQSNSSSKRPVTLAQARANAAALGHKPYRKPSLRTIGMTVRRGSTGEYIQYNEPPMAPYDFYAHLPPHAQAQQQINLPYSHPHDQRPLVVAPRPRRAQSFYQYPASAGQQGMSMLHVQQEAMYRRASEGFVPPNATGHQGMPPPMQYAPAPQHQQSQYPMMHPEMKPYEVYNPEPPITAAAYPYGGQHAQPPQQQFLSVPGGVARPGLTRNNSFGSDGSFDDYDTSGGALQLDTTGLGSGVYSNEPSPIESHFGVSPTDEHPHLDGYAFPTTSSQQAPHATSSYIGEYAEPHQQFSYGDYTSSSATSACAPAIEVTSVAGDIGGWRPSSTTPPDMSHLDLSHVQDFGAGSSVADAGEHGETNVFAMGQAQGMSTEEVLALQAHDEAHQAWLSHPSDVSRRGSTVSVHTLYAEEPSWHGPEHDAGIAEIGDAPQGDEGGDASQHQHFCNDAYLVGHLSTGDLAVTVAAADGSGHASVAVSPKHGDTYSSSGLEALVGGDGGEGTDDHHAGGAFEMSPKTYDAFMASLESHASSLPETLVGEITSGGKADDVDDQWQAVDAWHEGEVEDQGEKEAEEAGGVRGGIGHMQGLGLDLGGWTNAGVAYDYVSA